MVGSFYARLGELRNTLAASFHLVGFNRSRVVAGQWMRLAGLIVDPLVGDSARAQEEHWPAGRVACARRYSSQGSRRLF